MFGLDISARYERQIKRNQKEHELACERAKKLAQQTGTKYVEPPLPRLARTSFTW